MSIESARKGSDRTVIVVLGARSGSSALAGLLGLLGCKLPKNLMSASDSNAKGHFEPQDIADLHDDVLAAAGSVWSDWREFPSSWYNTPEAARYRRRLAEAFEENFGEAELPVLKEPRMCRLLPFWSGIFQDLGVEPVFCFIDRNPVEVAASLRARDGSSFTQGLLYYVRNHVDAEAATRGNKRAFASYEELLRNWRRVIVSISSRLGVRFRLTNQQQEAVDQFLDSSLRRQFRNSVKPPIDEVMTIADAVHAIFEELSAGPESLDARLRLDRLRTVFNQVVREEHPSLGLSAEGERISL